MSSRLTQGLLALSLLLNCFVLAGFVYRSWINPPHWRGHIGGSSPGQSGTWTSPLDALAQDLKLDDDQKQASKGLFEEYNTTRRDRYREIQKVRDAMSAELQKPEFDMPRIEALVEQMTLLRAEQQNESLRAVSQLSRHLRPDQRDQLHKILAERYGGGWSGRPSPGGPSGPAGPGGARPPRPPQ